MKRILIALLGFALSAGMLAAQDVAQDQTAPPPPPTAQADQTAPPSAQASAPPSSNALVARLSVVSGTVSTQRADTGEWEAGALNAPLVTGDKVAAGQGGRAEVQLDYANTLRLDGNSQVNLANLSNNQLQVQVASGTVDYSVAKGAQAAAEIDTPNVAIHPDGKGLFRVEVLSDSETHVIVRDGEAEVSTPQGSTTLKKGQLITVQGTDQPQYKITDAPTEDAWDKWNNNRDSITRDSVAVANTNPYYTGVQDLDGYGYWTYVPGYGQVWVPNEGAGWSPYSNGQWDYEPYWGWTWAGYEPWGWAPYHYGRWFNYGARWAWWPGPVTPFYRPFWAPAYVSFFGFGGGFGFGVGFGSFGWLPIGPGDIFHPWWGGVGFRGRFVGALAPERAGRAFYSNERGMLTNDHIRAGVVTQSSANFGRGAVGIQRGGMSVAALRQGQAIGGALPVAATHGVTTRAVGASARPSNAATHFFGTRAPESGVRANASAGTSFRGGESAPAARGAESSNGWQRFGSPNTAERGSTANSFANRGESQPAARGQQPAQGWQRFTPQSRAPESAGRSESSAARGESPSAARGNERPPLQIGRPVVQSPRSAPSYSAPRGSAPAPHYSAPAARGGGSFGGGRSSGGGGGHAGGGGHHR